MPRSLDLPVGAMHERIAQLVAAVEQLAPAAADAFDPDRPGRRGKRPAMRAIQALFNTPWAITEEGIETLLLVAARENLDPEAVAAQLGRKLDNTRAVTIRDGIATIEVVGAMFRYADFFTAVSGLTAYEELATDITTALNNQAVRAIVLALDTPGGDVNGLSQLADLVRAADEVKPVVAHIGGAGASAGYWLASAARRIIAADTAIVGSIGVRASYVNTRKQEEARGIQRVEIISSQSPNKAMDPTEDAGRAQLQRVMDDLAQVFVETVARNRGVSVETVLSDFGQGGVFVGRAALEAGLVDAIGTYESVLADLQRGELPAARATQSPAARVAAALPPSTQPTTTMPSDTNTPKAGKPKAADLCNGCEHTNCAEGGCTADSGCGCADCPDCSATSDGPEAEDGDEEKKKEEQARAAVAKAERTRVLAIQEAGAHADPKLVAKCIEEGVSVDAAKARFYDAEQAKKQAKLDALKGDDKGAAPAAVTPDVAATGEVEKGRAAAELFNKVTGRTRG